MMELEEKLEQSVMDIVQKMNEVNETSFTSDDLDISFNPEQTATRHKLFVFDQKVLEETAQIFNEHIWHIGVNETDNPLFTSDNPVATKPNKKDDWRSNAGIRSPGIEICM